MMLQQLTQSFNLPWSVIVPTAVGLSICGYIVYIYFFAPLAKIPGPFLAKFTKLWMAYRTKTGPWHRELISMHQRYGSIVRIAPDELSVADPQAFKEIYKAGGKFVKSELYGVVKGKRKFDLSGERDEAIHGAQRRLVARAYTKDSMRTLQASVDVLIVNLMKKLEQFDGKSVSLGYWLQLFAFDAIGAVSFSRSFGYVEAGNDNGLFARLRNSLKSISWLQHAPWIIYMHNAMMPLIGNWLAFNYRNVYFFEFAKTEVSQRKEQGGHNKDIVGQMLATQKEKPELDDTSMAFMMTTNVFAGSDTTATSLRAIILMLLRHPAAYRRLVDELVEKRAKGELSDPVTLEESEAWPYLQGVLYEGLRLYPAVGSSLPRVVPQGGMRIGDHYVPPGTVVGTSAWVINRIPEVWGPDADTYRPERWLDSRARAELRPYFFTFGSGSRICIGKNISWMEMAKLLPTILMHFDLSLADRNGGAEEYAGFVFLHGLEVRLKKRF